MKLALIGLFGGLPDNRGLDPLWATDPVARITPLARTCAQHGIPWLVLHIWPGSLPTQTGQYESDNITLAPPVVAKAMLSGAVVRACRAEGITRVDSYGGNFGVDGLDATGMDQYVQREILPLRCGGITGHWLDNTNPAGPVAAMFSTALHAHNLTCGGFEPCLQGNYVNGAGTALLAAPFPTITLYTHFKASYAAGMVVPAGTVSYVVFDTLDFTQADVGTVRKLGHRPVPHSVVCDLAADRLGWF